MSRHRKFLCMVAHRGQILEAFLRKNGVNLTKLADKLPWTVKTVYRHFQDADLAYDKLLKYAYASGLDIKGEFPDLDVIVLKEPMVSYQTKQIDQDYRKKYEELLEKYSDLLERYNSLLISQKRA